jgi:hypothetical protein
MFITNELRPRREEIISRSHESIASSLCRSYVGDDFLFSKMPISNFERLSALIQKEIDKLLADESYSMVGRLKVKDKIKKNKDGIFLRVSGSYFSDREGVSFNYKNNFVGFCDWADGCNRTPFILGFLNWVDELEGK